jgi:cyclopropane-fatty-acyl-phospholipid synthase
MQLKLARSTTSRDTVQALLEHADVRLDGSRPWDIQVHDDRFYDRVLAERTLGAGEAYVDGWWDCDAVDVLFERMIRADLEVKFGMSWADLWNMFSAKFLNQQRRSAAAKSAQAHYDIGNDLFRAMLDERMVYSCAYWRRARTLDEAQEAKLDLICRKLDLQPGMRLLDIGCGWGSLLQYAASHYGVEGVGITLAHEQAAFARTYCADWPVEIRVQDYRDLAPDRPFDRVASIEMIEHVGLQNYDAFMRVIKRCLAPDGLALIQTSGRQGDGPSSDPWIVKYIFPGGSFPSAVEMAEAVGTHFTIEDWHNLGADFDPTLMAWSRNVEAQWASLPDRYDERFQRMWQYYLLQCAGIFRSRHNHVWQVVLSPDGVPGGYRSVR